MELVAPAREDVAMLVDAGTSPWAKSEGLLGRMTSCADALTSPLKQEVFDILDAIGEQDRRVNAWWLAGRRDAAG